MSKLKDYQIRDCMQCMATKFEQLNQPRRKFVNIVRKAQKVINHSHCINGVGKLHTNGVRTAGVSISSLAPLCTV